METISTGFIENRFGLDAFTLEALTHLVEQSENVDSAVLFGSRAMGNFKPGSDIDIALAGENLSYHDEMDLRIAIEQLDLIWKVDLVRMDTISSTELLAHIKRVGTVIFKR